MTYLDLKLDFSQRLFQTQKQILYLDLICSFCTVYKISFCECNLMWTLKCPWPIYEENWHIQTEIDIFSINFLCIFENHFSLESNDFLTICSWISLIWFFVQQIDCVCSRSIVTSLLDRKIIIENILVVNNRFWFVSCEVSLKYLH